MVTGNDTRWISCWTVYFTTMMVRTSEITAQSYKHFFITSHQKHIKTQLWSTKNSTYLCLAIVNCNCYLQQLHHIIVYLCLRYSCKFTTFAANHNLPCIVLQHSQHLFWLKITIAGIRFGPVTSEKWSKLPIVIQVSTFSNFGGPALKSRTGFNAVFLAPWCWKKQVNIKS